MSTSQKYGLKSMAELSQNLQSLSGVHKTDGLSTELRDFISMLKLQRLRHSSDAHTFCTSGGLRVLLDLLSRCRESSENRDLLLLLGTLGNLCAVDSESRTMVMQSKVNDIVHILQSTDNSETLNTTSRLLANLGLDELNIDGLRERGVVTILSQLLARDSLDIACKKSVIRAVRILATSPECREELKACEGTQPLVDCLKSDNEELAVATVQALEVMTQECDQDIIQPLCNKPTMQSIVRFCNHTKTKTRRSAINVLLNCAKSSDGRIALSSAGGVETMVGFMQSSSKDSSTLHKVVCAACSCCRDVISRQRLRDCGGLERLIKMLATAEHAALHECIMSALVCYYFDENTLKVMVKKLGLLKALKFHLQEMTRRTLERSKSVGEANVAGTDDPGPDTDEESTEEEDDKVKPQKGRCEEMPKEKTFMQATALCLQKTLASEGSQSRLLQCEVKRNLSSPARLEHLALSSTSAESTRVHVDIQHHTPSKKRPSVSTAASPEISCPPTKRPRLQIDIEASTPMPANFLDSLLSSPSPYKKMAKQPESPFTYEFGTHLETQVILMLSRVSHLRDCLTSLASSDILLTTLRYFTSSTPSNDHIFKVLTRVFVNPHCFQDCLASLVPSKIFELLRQPRAEHSDSQVACNLQGLLSPQSPLLSDLEQNRKFVGMCRDLLERLSKVAESPYGQGVLAHTLLRGDEREKQASCLSLPLLCRSPRICQRMMVSYGGFQVLSSLSQDNEASEIQLMALDSLLVLAHNMQQAPSRKRRQSYLAAHDRDTSSCLPPPGKLPRLDYSFKDLSLSEAESLPLFSGASQHWPWQPHSKQKAYCRHRDSDHCPFDLNIIVQGPRDETVSISVHKSTLIEESDVFRVMLGGQYKEATCSVVRICDTPPTAFMSLIHHIYGCGWMCDTLMERVLREGQEEELRLSEAMDQSQSSTSVSWVLSEANRVLVTDITSHCRTRDDAKRAEHCLQVLACAGRFLLSELVTRCEHAVVKYMCPANMVALFHFAQLHQCYCLGESCVRAVVGLPHSQLRTNVFKDLVNSPEGDAALDIIMLFLTAAEY